VNLTTIVSVRWLVRVRDFSREPNGIARIPALAPDAVPSAPPPMRQPSCVVSLATLS
jgi:hypothetical protein